MHGTPFCRRGLRDSRGFTLIEVAVVCLILGVLAAFAFPSVARFADRQQTRSSATQIAGALGEARSRAIAEATPHLVYFNPNTPSESGGCGPTAVVVRDSDRSYTISEGDRVREIALEPGACKKVKRVGDSEASEEAELPLPSEDMATRGLTASRGAEAAPDPKGPESELPNENPGLKLGRVVDAVVDGATFPIDEESGRPVLAFTERGIPVDPANPTSWGSGAGALYLTDGNSTVYAALVAPMGGVKVRFFDHGSREWR